MISVRIQKILNSYKRKISNTQQFQNDLAVIDKFIVSLNDSSNYYKLRTKYMDVINIFDKEAIDEYIREYFFDLYYEDSISAYNELYAEVKQLEKKNVKR